MAVISSRQFLQVSGACLAMGFARIASASVVSPFTENFAGGASGWRDNASLANLAWQSSGGPAGSSYVSTSYNFLDLAPGVPFPGNAVNLFRAQDEWNSSDNAFVGDWLAGGVTEFSFMIRHNASTSLNVFTRFSTANNFPAWSGVEFTPIAPNTWTLVTIDIALSNPGLFYEGPPGAGQAQFNAVFSSIGHVQIGAFAGSLADVNETVTFDLDQVAIAPAPGALALLAIGGCMGAKRRRRGS